MIWKNTKYQRMGNTKYVNNKEYIQLLVHRLVCQMFHPNPHCFKIVDHIDGNGKNNHFLNLRWVSSSQNMYNRVIANKKYLNGIVKLGNRYKVSFGRGKGKFHYFKTYLEAAKYRLQFEKETAEFFRAQIPEKVTLEILNEIIDGF
jgi:HNH endonuclease